MAVLIAHQPDLIDTGALLQCARHIEGRRAGCRRHQDRGSGDEKSMCELFHVSFMLRQNAASRQLQTVKVTTTMRQLEPSPTSPLIRLRDDGFSQARLLLFPTEALGDMMISGLQRMENKMEYAIVAAAALCLSTLSVQAAPKSQRTASQGTGCVARVLHSEELPYAPIGYWLGKVTLEVIPSSGAPFITTLHHNVPWQRSVPRRGETISVRCDPANYSLTY